MGDALEMAKRAAPTRPHPLAPDTPPANLVAGAVSAVMDIGRDALRAARRKATTKVRTGPGSGEPEAGASPDVRGGRRRGEPVSRAGRMLRRAPGVGGSGAWRTMRQGEKNEGHRGGVNAARCPAVSWGEDVAARPRTTGPARGGAMSLPELSVPCFSPRCCSPAWWPPRSPRPCPPAAPPVDPAVRTIRVEGTGEVKAQPDEAFIDLAVETWRRTRRRRASRTRSGWRR